MHDNDNDDYDDGDGDDQGNPESDDKTNIDPKRVLHRHVTYAQAVAIISVADLYLQQTDNLQLEAISQKMPKKLSYCKVLQLISPLVNSSETDSHSLCTINDSTQTSDCSPLI